MGQSVRRRVCETGSALLRPPGQGAGGSSTPPECSEFLNCIVCGRTGSAPRWCSKKGIKQNCGHFSRPCRAQRGLIIVSGGVAHYVRSTTGYQPALLWGTMQALARGYTAD
jgi:hypothetical protein